MPFYEIVYETGSKSVAEYNNDEEALRATQAHHERAVNGTPALSSATGGDPQANRPAERIVKVLKYDQHPDDYNITQAVATKDLLADVSKIVHDAAVGDLVSVHDVAAGVRDLTSPVKTEAEMDSAHDSMYRMKEQKDIWKEPAVSA